MIDPAQIPDEVVEAAKEACRHTDEKTMSDWLAEIIAAALNAWPGVEVEIISDGTEQIILPLSHENNDD